MNERVHPVPVFIILVIAMGVCARTANQRLS
jgi:hypothetical protein